MDLVNDEASITAQREDRISNLSDDIIHRILSFLDIKYAIQTSLLSRRWKHIWTSMPYLKLNNRLFRSMAQFAKFVKHVLCHRNSNTEVSTVELTLAGPPTHSVVESIINYAYLYNFRKLTIIWSTSVSHVLPQYLFSSRTLKHLVLNDQSQPSLRRCTSIYALDFPALDFPALETLNLTNLYIGSYEKKSLDLFSKCVNLEDITLHNVTVVGFEIFICAPELLNLTVTNCSISSKVFNVVASQLKNLTISGHKRFPQVFNLVAPQLKNLTATCSTDASSPYILALFTEGLNSLERVNLSLSSSYKKENHVSRLLNLFQILRSAKYLILDVYIIQTLSSGMDQLIREPCPFDNLKCLKISAVPLKPKDPVPIIPTQVRNYLLKNSPRAAFIMNLPQVPKKRSMQQVPNYTMANKVAKVDAGEKQPPTTADEKKMLEAQIQMQVQVIAKQGAYKKKQNHVIKKQKAKILMQDRAIAKQMAKIRMQDGAIAKQMAKIKKQNRVIAKQKTKIQMQNANNVQSRSVVSAELSDTKTIFNQYDHILNFSKVSSRVVQPSQSSRE